MFLAQFRNCLAVEVKMRVLCQQSTDLCLICWYIWLLKWLYTPGNAWWNLSCFVLLHMQDQCTLTEHSLHVFLFLSTGCFGKTGRFQLRFWPCYLFMCVCTLVRKVTRGHKFVTSELSKHLLSCMCASVCGETRLCVAIWRGGLTYSALKKTGARHSQQAYRFSINPLAGTHEDKGTGNKRNQNVRENWGLISTAQS